MQANSQQSQVQRRCIIEYTQECLKHNIPESLPPNVRNFIQKMQNWDLHRPNKASWCANDKKYEQEKQFVLTVLKSKVFAFIKSTKVKTLFLFQHSTKVILKAIVLPCYEKLKWLSLSSNKIQNIEAIAFLDVSVLEKLDLDKNVILTTKAFNKTVMKNLNRLSLQNNQIREMEICRSQWANCIERFVFEEKHKDKCTVFFLFKLNSTTAKVITLKYPLMIKQNKLLPKILQRFKNQNQPMNIFVN